MRRIYKRLIVSMMVAGMLFLAGCLFGPGEVPGGGTLTFVADNLVGPPSLDDGGFKVTFNCAGGNGEYVISFGDGATGVPASPISHTYTKVGSYTATCTSGTETASLVVTVENSPYGTLYEPLITGHSFSDCYYKGPIPIDPEDPPEPPDCGKGTGQWWWCDSPYEGCDLRLCKTTILDGRYYTTGFGANKKYYGIDPCCGYELIYSWKITMASVCAALDIPLYVYGEGETVLWRIGHENPELDPNYPVLTSEGSMGPLEKTPWFPGKPYGPKVALAEITLTVTDQFGSYQSITVERWVCTCEGCGASPCTDYPIEEDPCDPCDD